MGAIAGWMCSAGAAPDPAQLVPMLDGLSHRSRRETAGAYIDQRRERSLVLGATLTDPGGIALAFDGAIVNRDALRKDLARRGHRFDGTSDAELLLRVYQHWDKDAVKQLRGAFAFAIWDARKERVLLARDRFGEKPLYLHERPGALFFASEPRALLALPEISSDVDLAAVADYLRLGYVPGPRTLVAAIRKLAPGTCALWQFGRLREIRYWSPPDGEPSRQPAWAQSASRDPVSGFIERLEEAVALNMQGDAPVGALLSGGFDSAVIVALMKRHSERVDTFAAGFAEDRRSELPAAARVAKALGTTHHELVAAPREVLAHLPELVARRDAPFTRPSDVALHLFAAQAAKSVRVALTGDGGDEIVGGYRRYTVLRGLARGPRRTPGLYVIPVPPSEPRPQELRAILYYEQLSWLPDGLLERTDRMTLTAALETRAPFLDHRLAEYVSSLPDGLRVRGFATKRVLRRAAAKLVPLRLRQGGFRIPVGELLRGEYRDFLLEHLRGPRSATRAYCEAAVLDRVIDEHLAVRKNHEELLWTLLNLEIWHRTYRPAACA